MGTSSIPSPRDLLAAFALAFPGERFCALCLARRIGAGVHTVRRALAELHAEGVSAAVEGQCTACRRRAQLLDLHGRPTDVGNDAGERGERGDPAPRTVDDRERVSAPCPVCGRAFLPDDRVIRAGAWLFHTACLQGAGLGASISGGSAPAPWPRLFEAHVARRARSPRGEAVATADSAGLA
jgi:hypothetical protein